MAGRKIQKKKQKRGTCWACEREDQPIACHRAEHDDDESEFEWVCGDCHARWWSWAMRVGRVIKALEEALVGKPAAVRTVDMLRTVLESEEYAVETPQLDRWLEKLVAA